MNKVFLSGVIDSDVEVYFSPKGDKIFIFSLFIEEGRFSIEVVYKNKGTSDVLNLKKSDKVVASGALIKAKKVNQDIFRLEANKLFVTEV
ncbi:MAG: hypothetical protein N3D15_00715 [Syntrophorhabdaceae bacterium]|nr:hypothetical protein [Syntrophorhabdaceae bacterium]